MAFGDIPTPPQFGSVIPGLPAMPGYMSPAMPMMPIAGEGQQPQQNIYQMAQDYIQSDPHARFLYNNPFLLFPGSHPDTGTPTFYGRHPGFTRGLESVLMTLGNMGPPGMTAGENISNTARALTAYPQAQRAHYMEQTMFPLQIAEAILGRQKTEADITKSLTESQAEMLKAQGMYQWYTGGAIAAQRGRGAEAAGIHEQGKADLVDPTSGAPAFRGPDGKYVDANGQPIAPDALTHYITPQTFAAQAKVAAVKARVQRMGPVQQLADAIKTGDASSVAALSKAFAIMAGTQAGARYSAVFGKMSPTDRQGLANQAKLLTQQFSEISKDPIMWSATHAGQDPEAALNDIQTRLTNLFGLGEDHSQSAIPQAGAPEYTPPAQTPAPSKPSAVPKGTSKADRAGIF